MHPNFHKCSKAFHTKKNTTFVTISRWKRNCDVTFVENMENMPNKNRLFFYSNRCIHLTRCLKKADSCHEKNHPKQMCLSSSTSQMGLGQKCKTISSCQSIHDAQTNTHTQDMHLVFETSMQPNTQSAHSRYMCKCWSAFANACANVGVM